MTSGSTLGRYQLLAPLARGGMGDLWIARVTGAHGFEKLFAVKTIRREHAGDAAMRRMFLDEARVASRIDHPNVVRVLDLGEDDGVLFLAMDYVEGHSVRALHDVLARSDRRIPLPIVLRIAADVCAGLHAAHELRDATGTPLGLVHRDVSPDNALVGHDGRTRLIDFGIAKITSRLTGDTQTDAAKGRLGYMAPEQALGQPIDRRADVWSVGAVMVHLLEGAPPVRGAQDLPRVWGLLGPQPPLRFASTVPACVARVVGQALGRDRRQRHASALALAEAIEEALSELGERVSTADVAAFVDAHLGEARARRRALVSAAAPLRRTPTVRRATKVVATLALGAALGGAAVVAVVAVVATRTKAPVTPAAPMVMVTPAEDADARPSTTPLATTTTTPTPPPRSHAARTHAPRPARPPRPATVIADDDTIR